MPAIAVADALRAEGAEVSFVGTRERAEADLVPAAGYEIDYLRVSGLNRRNPIKAAIATGRAVRAVGAARRLLGARRADVVLGGGGYVAGPVGLAGCPTGCSPAVPAGSVSPFRSGAATAVPTWSRAARARGRCSRLTRPSLGGASAFPSPPIA